MRNLTGLYKKKNPFLFSHRMVKRTANVAVNKCGTINVAVLGS